MSVNLIPLHRIADDNGMILPDEEGDNLIPLHQIPCGKKARVRRLNSTGSERRRMMDLGLILGTSVESLIKSPSGDPTAYEIRGAVIALRSEAASKILVEML
jgi:ferrous iron transport protein A